MENEIGQGRETPKPGDVIELKDGTGWIRCRIVTKLSAEQNRDVLQVLPGELAGEDWRWPQP